MLGGCQHRCCHVEMVPWPGGMSPVVAMGKRQNRQEGTHAAEAALKQQCTNERTQRWRHGSDDPGHEGGKGALNEGLQSCSTQSRQTGKLFYVAY